MLSYTNFSHPHPPILSFDVHNLLIPLIVLLVIQITFAVVIYVTRWDKITDAATGTCLCASAILSLCLSQTYFPRQLLASVFQCLWTSRLSVYLLYRAFRTNDNGKFRERRKSFAQYFGFWAFQTISVMTLSLPVLMLNSPVASIPKLQLHFVLQTDCTGSLLYLLGIILESIADAQELVFRDDPANDMHWCDFGIWRYSRHPNYLGEMMVAWGIFLVTMASLEGIRWCAIAGPIFITLLLLMFNGIPSSEKHNDVKFGGIPGYRVYKRRTSPLFPVPPAIYTRLPYLVKLLCFLELPLYNFLENDPNDPNELSLYEDPKYMLEPIPDA